METSLNNSLILRYTHNEKRYHSEVRQEAVQQALAAMQSKAKPTVPMPSKRSSVMKTSQQDSGKKSRVISGNDSLSNTFVLFYTFRFFKPSLIRVLDQGPVSYTSALLENFRLRWKCLKGKNTYY